MEMEHSSPQSTWHTVNELEGPRKKALRTSCDICQSLKIKCSQDKPSCYRCVKHGLDCVYSPLKRMGRPRKGVTNSTPSSYSQRRDARSDPEQSAPPRQRTNANCDIAHHDGVVLGSTSDPDALDNWARSVDGLSTTALEQNLATSSVAAHGKTSPSAIQITESSIPNGNLGPRDNFAHIYSDTVMGDIQGSADAGATLSNSFISSEQHDHHRSTPTNGFWRLAGPSLNPPPDNSQSGRLWSIDGPGPRPSESGQSHFTPTSTIAQNEASPDRSYHTGRQYIDVTNLNDGEADTKGGCRGQCYISILQRLVQLEQSLTVNPGHPSLDFVLTAERDARALKERLFECHSCNRKNIGEDATVNTTTDGSCLDTRPSSLLILTVLADRVVGLLEDLFRRASVAAHGFDRALRTACYMNSPMSPSQETDVESGASKRLERSSRSAFDRNINCPVPEANCELVIGNYELDNEAKSRAMKRILRLRIGGLERMVCDMGAYLTSRAVGTSSRRGDADSSSLGNLLGAIKSSEAHVATSTMVKDLHRRIELLQGRLELAE